MVCFDSSCSFASYLSLFFLYQGMNVVLFGSYLFVSWYKRKQPRVNRAIMTTGIFMFLFSTIHVSLGFQRLIEGFIVLRNQPGGPAAFFSDVSIPANVAKVCIHTINVSHLVCTISVYRTDCSVTLICSLFWVTASWYGDHHIISYWL